jgi:hypothetical protein
MYLATIALLVFALLVNKLWFGKRKSLQINAGLSNKYDAMTVNERLVESGLLKSWDRAAMKKDTKEMSRILALVNLGDQSDVIIQSEFDRIRSNGG